MLNLLNNHVPLILLVNIIYRKVRYKTWILYSEFTLYQTKPYRTAGSLYPVLTIIEISCPSKANIYISKCYFTKYYLAKYCKRKKIEIFLGIDFLCVKINLLYKWSYRVIDDLWSIIYYIICTLIRIKNVLIYIAYTYMHCGWIIILLRQYSES